MYGTEFFESGRIERAHGAFVSYARLVTDLVTTVTQVLTAVYPSEATPLSPMFLHDLRVLQTQASASFVLLVTKMIFSLSQGSSCPVTNTVWSRVVG